MNSSRVPHTPKSQKGSALFLVLACVLILGAVIGIALIQRSGSSALNSPIAASPHLYEAQIFPSPLTASVAFVQANASLDKSWSSATVTSSYSSAETAGDLNVVVVGWHGGGNSVTSVKKFGSPASDSSREDHV